jgi:hypothetical protein
MQVGPTAMAIGIHRNMVTGKKETDMGMWDEYINLVDKYFKYLETDFGFNRISTEPSSI